MPPRFGKVVVVGDGATPPANAYEAERAARIALNKERMAQLGILDTTRALAQGGAKSLQLGDKQHTRLNLRLSQHEQASAPRLG